MLTAMRSGIIGVPAMNGWRPSSPRLIHGIDFGIAHILDGLP